MDRHAPEFAYISTVERSQRNVGIDGIERIAKALKVTMAQLLEE